MKNLLLVASLSVATYSTLAQGTFTFSNRILAAGLDQPIYYGVDNHRKMEGSHFVAAIFLNGVQLGAAAPFRTGTVAGYWDAGTDNSRSVGGKFAGDVVIGFTVRVWDSYLGISAESHPFSITLGGPNIDPSLPPAIPGVMLNFKGFAPALLGRPRLNNPDFDENGSPDLLWQHSDGTIAVWLQSGGKLLAPKLFTPSSPGSPDWRIVGTGDFDNDLIEDLVWQHDDGTLAIWRMGDDRLTLRDAAYTVPSNAGNSKWRVVAVGDMDSNGRPDLVWQHTNGAIAYWLMDDQKATQFINLELPQPADSRWRIAGSGDFNGDGKPDLLWQHAATGDIAVWLMNGTRIIKGDYISPKNAGGPENWKIRAVADINRDGKCDIVLQNQAGRVAYWLMDGTRLSSGQFFQPHDPGDVGWQIVGPK